MILKRIYKLRKEEFLNKKDYLKYLPVEEMFLLENILKKRTPCEIQDIKNVEILIFLDGFNYVGTVKIEELSLNLLDDEICFMAEYGSQKDHFYSIDYGEDWFISKEDLYELLDQVVVRL